ncbi:VgrG-related protein [Deinococcus sedimenti]|uniref:Type IV secretion protein Rhs n=1 Tax=Deinococcus sedimenti TaxID=1867090 RepID=A0ABQ2S300_9DEIO|nr:VgrG-related protein [Deinococcus sedimenti]GGR92824.1 type IV secretion protein Rhs [Deinococcus sedimenti]
MTRVQRDALEGAVSTLYLNLNGRDMPEEQFRMIDEITVDSSLQLPDVASITLRDPEGELVDDTTYKLGARIKVIAQVRGNKETVFDGEIVEIEPRFSQGTQQLRLRAFDRLHRLSRGTHTKSYQNVSDMDLVKKIAGEVGLTAKTGSASIVHAYVLQHNQSHLAFLRERAARLGYILFVDGTTLHCEPVRGQDPITLTWGDNLSEFLPRLSSLNQTSGSTVRSWDPKQKRAVSSEKQSGEGKAKVEEETRSEQVAQQAFSMKASATSSALIVRDQGYADAIAQAQRNRVAEGLLEARGHAAGYPRLTAGTQLDIRNVGQRFSGSYVASSVRHVYRNGEGYSTEFAVTGSHPDSLAGMIRQATGGAGGSAGGAFTPAPGLMIGIVTNNDDPDNQGRVKLKLPALTEDDETDWARVVNLGGGPGRGSQHTPEVNDEVLVGFEHGDIHHPYVIGGLWNGTDAPPRPTGKVIKNGKVIQRVYRTRLGHEFIYDDPEDPDPPKITLQSSKGHAIELNDDKKKPFAEYRTKAGHRLTLMDDPKGPFVVLRDKNGNEVKLDSKSNTLTITSTGRLELKATRGIRIDGGGGNVDVKGVLINLN